MQYLVDTKAEVILQNQEVKIMDLKKDTTYIVGLKVPEPDVVFSKPIYYDAIQYHIETMADQTVP